MKLPKLSQFYRRDSLGKDLASGATLGVESIPDSMGIGILAGLNPVSGIYAYMVGAIAGAFATSSVIMSVQATTAGALIIAEIPSLGASKNPDLGSLVLLGLMVGLIMIAAGLAGLGKILRLVPPVIMLAFTFTLGVLMVLGQLEGVTGVTLPSDNKLIKLWELATNLDKIQLPTVTIAVITAITIFAFQRTKLKSLAILFGVIVGSVVAKLAGWDVQTVGDIAPIPGSLPLPMLPSFKNFGELVAPAFAIAAISLLQGAVIAKDVPNPDGSKTDPSGDFIGQGVGNIFSALFRGMPVGGSFSATMIIKAVGGRTRLANISAGLMIALILLTMNHLIEQVAMPAIASFLLVLGIGLASPAKFRQIVRLGRIGVFGIIGFLIVGIWVSIPAAVLFGVGLAMIAYVSSQANSLKLKQLSIVDCALVDEGDPLPTIPANSKLVLRPYGAVFYGSAELLQEQLPQPTSDSAGATVILDLYYEKLDYGVLEVIDDYASRLHQHGCSLILANIHKDAYDNLEGAPSMSNVSFVNTPADNDDRIVALNRALDGADSTRNPISS